MTMTSTDLPSLIKKIKAAKTPEKLFGELGINGDREESLHRQFRTMARVLHPDYNPGNKAAAEAMAALTELNAKAEMRLKSGSYGTKDPDKGVEIRSKTLYTGVKPIAAGEICDVYMGDFMDAGGKPRRAVIKILRDVGDDDLFNNEAVAYKQVFGAAKDEDKVFAKYMCEPLERAKLTIDGREKKAFIIAGSKRTTYSLADVIKAYPDGIDHRDAAWMIRRLLEILAFTHRIGYAHNAVTPSHALVRMEDHGGKLVDWSYAKPVGEPIIAISSEYEHLYPPETKKNKVANPASDIFMVAQCYVALCGGEHRVFTKGPKTIAGIMRAATLHHGQRYQNALEMYKAYDMALRELYGPPSWRNFEMPEPPADNS
jgi:serine/threonine protein kinase